MRVRVFFALFLALLLFGCQTAPTAISTVSPGASPSETPRPVATVTPKLTSTPVLTPTISPAELKRRAGPICENAFSALVESGPFLPPFAVLKKMKYADAPAWDVSHPLPHLGSVSAAEAKTVFCISETRTQTGTYTDGSAAYQLFWEIRAVSWPGGKVIRRHSLTGSAPPETKIFSSSSAEGGFPYKEFAAWVFSQVDHSDFLYFENAITRLAISPDGRLAAFGTAIASQIVDREYRAKIFLFDPTDMQTELGTSSFLRVLDGHQGMVTSLAFSPDGNMLASSGYDSLIKFWDVDNGGLLGQVRLTETPNFLTFSADGEKLAVASNLEVTLIQPDSMQIEKSILASSAGNLAFSLDGKLIYASKPFRMTVIDISAGTKILEFPDPSALVPTLTTAADGTVASVSYATPDTVDNFALSSDGTQIFTYTVDQFVAGSADAENVRLARWDAETGKYLNETKFKGDSVGVIKISPVGNLLALGNNNEVWIWDTVSWQIVKRFSGHTDLVEALSFTPDGTQLLSAGRDGTIRVWSLEE